MKRCNGNVGPLLELIDPSSWYRIAAMDALIKTKKTIWAVEVPYEAMLMEEYVRLC
jgi:hypothetical protein